MSKHEQLNAIQDSLENGQRQQMVEQIDEYGTYDFFADFANHLEQYYINCDTEPGCYWTFKDVVVSYFRIKGR